MTTPFEIFGVHEGYDAQVRECRPDRVTDRLPHVTTFAQIFQLYTLDRYQRLFSRQFLIPEHTSWSFPNTHLGLLERD